MMGNLPAVRRGVTMELAAYSSISCGRCSLTRAAIATVCLAVVFSAGSVNAALIGQVVSNNYSNIQPGMPNYGIAQGSKYFTMGGTKDMTESTASQGVPLQTSLAGVTITVTVGGVTTQAIPYFM